MSEYVFWFSWLNQWFKLDQTGITRCHARVTTLNTEYKSAYYSAVMHWSFMKHVLEGAGLINYVKI